MASGILRHHIAYMSKHTAPPRLQALASPAAAWPELGYIGHAVFPRACHGLDEHDHGPALEVLVYRRGRQVFGVEKQRLVVDGDELVLFPPRVRHSSACQPQARAEVYWLQIQLELKRPFLGNQVHEPLRRQLRALARPEVRCATTWPASTNSPPATFRRPPFRNSAAGSACSATSCWPRPPKAPAAAPPPPCGTPSATWRNT